MKKSHNEQQEIIVTRKFLNEFKLHTYTVDRLISLINKK